jgi:hypothetical protein
MGRRVRRGHHGPAPSLLPVVPRPEVGIDRRRVESVMAWTCWRKKPYPSQAEARRAAARASAADRKPIHAYRCAFHLPGARPHWHIGHPPSMTALSLYARAIRWCAANPDDVPVRTPSRRVTRPE